MLLSLESIKVVQRQKMALRQWCSLLSVLPVEERIINTECSPTAGKTNPYGKRRTYHVAFPSLLCDFLPCSVRTHGWKTRRFLQPSDCDQCILQFINETDQENWFAMHLHFTQADTAMKAVKMKSKPGIPNKDTRSIKEIYFCSCPGS